MDSWVNLHSKFTACFVAAILRLLIASACQFADYET